jgi:hypothetical protein
MNEKVVSSYMEKMNIVIEEIMVENERDGYSNELILALVSCLAALIAAECVVNKLDPKNVVKDILNSLEVKSVTKYPPNVL